VDRLLSLLGRGRSAAIREYRRLMREPVEEPYEEAGAILSSIIEGSASRAGVSAEHGEEPVERGIALVETLFHAGPEHAVALLRGVE
jgi:hypothetical protein